MARRNGSGVETRRPAAGAGNGATGLVEDKAVAGTTMTPEQMVEFYRLMYLSRRMDDREIMLKRQQKIFFQVSGAGHEALLVAAALAMKPGYDWFFPYYRDRALCLALGNTPEEQFLQAVGAAADQPAAAGRCRRTGQHRAAHRLAVLLDHHPVSAGGWMRRGRALLCAPSGSCGEGRRATTASSRTLSSTATRSSTSPSARARPARGILGVAQHRLQCQLPVLFVVEDNEYAISVPVEVNTPGGNISRLVANFPNFHFAEIDGTDPVASYSALSGSGRLCALGEWPGVGAWPCRAAVFAFAFRR